MKTLFKGKIFTIPNFLTLLRICMIPFLVWVYVGRRDTLLTVLILVLSGLTDVLDGIIARRFDMVSDLGKALDPLADKLTQATVVGCLLVRFPIMIVMLVIFCIKEIFVTIAHLALVQRSGRVSGARWHGKATTVLLWLTMVLHLLWAEIPPALTITLVCLCTAMILLSGALYGIEYIVGFRTCEKPEKEE